MDRLNIAAPLIPEHLTLAQRGTDTDTDTTWCRWKKGPMLLEENLSPSVQLLPRMFRRWLVRSIETGLKSHLNVAVLSCAPPHARKYIPLLGKSPSFGEDSPTFVDVVATRITAASRVRRNWPWVEGTFQRFSLPLKRRLHVCLNRFNPWIFRD